MESQKPKKARKHGPLHEAPSAIPAGLGPSQVKAFLKIMAGESILLTGSAGTGKSFLLKTVVDRWSSEEPPRRFAMTATTGIAAVQIEGKTFHSFMWMSPDDEDLSAGQLFKDLSRLPMYRWYKRSMCALQSLVIDEVSMMSPQLFLKASELLKLVRDDARPFGGLQMILVGDFYQLPPVFRLRSGLLEPSDGPTGGASGGPLGQPEDGCADDQILLFDLPEFHKTVTDRVILEQVFRQSDDAFVALLGRMRTGDVTSADIEVLRSRVGADVGRFGIVPTELFSTNRDVDRLNNDKLSQIKTPSVVFERIHGIKDPKDEVVGEARDKAIAKFLKDLNVPNAVELKSPDYDYWAQQDASRSDNESSGSAKSADLKALEHGTQVMLTFNLRTDRGLCNGSRGVVIRFQRPPLGVANSRALFQNFDPDDSKQIKSYPVDMELPVVRFIVDKKPLDILVPYVRRQRRIQNSDGSKRTRAYAYAWVMPLKLAWATTVHKSQSQSLDCLKVSLDSSVFADGQAYVAVSRARSLEGLTLSVFRPEVIRSSARVKAFYETSFLDLRAAILGRA